MKSFKEHIKEGMVDVVHKRCIADNCDIINPVFNYATEKKGLFYNFIPKFHF